MDVKSKLAAIEAALNTAKAEELKLAGGCRASGARCRNALLEIAKLVSEGRKDALSISKSIPVKKRQPKVEGKSESSGDETPPPQPELTRQAGVVEVVPEPAPAAAEQKKRGRKPKAVVSVVVPA